MTQGASVMFWISFLAIIYCYFVYFILLRFLRLSRRSTQSAPKDGVTFGVSIIISAYNEGKKINSRLTNIAELDSSPHRLEVVLGSDGSTDNTVDVAKDFSLVTVKALEYLARRGRAAIQNDAVGIATGEILIFTDADTKFEKDFLSKIAGWFFDRNIGCVVGSLIYRSVKSTVSKGEGLYWKFEKKLRKLESDIGILATGSGACMAIRRSLWKDLEPTDDCDFTSPLDVISQGFRVIYAPDAIAYDFPSSTLTQEFKTRVRQTAKNLVGTLRRWGWKGWIKHPFVSWGLLSHKILRWFSAFFMVGTLLSNLFLLGENVVYQIAFIIQLAFYALGLFGLLGEVIGKRVPVASSVLVFCVAAVGMGIGVIKGILGKAPASYSSE